MKKTPYILASAMLMVGSALTGCGSSYESPPPAEPPAPLPPPPPAVFSEFVKEQFAATSDDTDPVAVDDMEFSFDDDPAAFNDLLADP